MIRCDARVALPEAQETQEQPWRGNEIKCPAPAEMSTDQSADHIAERAANRNRRTKNRHDATPRFDWEKIGQDRRGRRPVAAFANSDAYASRKENAECRGKTRPTAGQTPQNHSATNDDPARESIGEQAENWRADHVSHEKCDAQQTRLGHRVYVVGCKKTCANVRLERSQNLPVDIVKKIDAQEQKERVTRAGHRYSPNRLHCNCRLQFARRRL